MRDMPISIQHHYSLLKHNTFAMDVKAKQFISYKSVDELIEIQREVGEELNNKGGKILLPSGDLVTGVDIAVGSYMIEPHNVSDEDYSHCYAITVWKSRELKEQYDRDYEEYRAAYKKADENKEAGKDYEYPQELVESDYVTFDSEFDHTQTAKVTLEEGNILQWRTLWGVKLNLTIEKAKGLFMD